MKSPIQRLFSENEDGVHLEVEGEYTLCGDALEGEDDFGDETAFGELKPTNKRTVTCPRCRDIILMCRGVRVSPP